MSHKKNVSAHFNKHFWVTKCQHTPFVVWTIFQLTFCHYSSCCSNKGHQGVAHRDYYKVLHKGINTRPFHIRELYQPQRPIWIICRCIKCCNMKLPAWEGLMKLLQYSILTVASRGLADGTGDISGSNSDSSLIGRIVQYLGV